MTIGEPPPRDGQDALLPFSRSAILLAVLFLFAGLNACSFFVRNDYPWARLTEETQGLFLDSFDVELGFPLIFRLWLVWPLCLLVTAVVDDDFSSVCFAEF